MFFKNSLKSLIYLGLNYTFGLLPVKKASILMYHSIDYNPVFFTMRPEGFQKQMNYLFKKNYNVVALNKLIEYIKNKNIPPKTVVLTFDDGYEDNYFNAFPVLKKYNFPATIFLATGFVGKKKISKSKGISFQMLNWQQIKEMHNSGLIDFEPHTMSHPKLNQIPLKKAKKEILESKEIIEQNLDKKCRFFAYPYGKYNQEIKESLKKNKFWAAVAIKEGLVLSHDDLFNLKRNSVDSLVSFIQFKGKLNYSVILFHLLKTIFK